MIIMRNDFQFVLFIKRGVFLMLFVLIWSCQQRVPKQEHIEVLKSVAYSIPRGYSGYRSLLKYQHVAGTPCVCFMNRFEQRVLCMGMSSGTVEAHFVPNQWVPIA